MRVCVCMYVCMYVCTYVRMYVCTYVRMYVCMHVCMYVCVCMYVPAIFENQLEEEWEMNLLLEII